MTPPPNTLILFAKAPRPGHVKTRLIGYLSPRQAAEIYHRLLLLTLDTLRTVNDARIILAASPDDADFSDYVDSNIEVRPQGDGNLGRRLSRGIAEAFENGARRVVTVGADCPRMTPGDLTRAFDLLDEHDVVIGPAADGGYYLLGLRDPVSALFEGIDWSSSRVLAQTRARAATAGLGLALLDERRDVDTMDDLTALLGDIPVDDPRLGDFKAFLHSLIEDRSRAD